MDEVEGLRKENATLQGTLDLTVKSNENLRADVLRLEAERESLIAEHGEAVEQAFELEKELERLRAGVPSEGDYVVLDGEVQEVAHRHATKEFMNQIKLQNIPDNKTCVALDRDGD
jgi:hypothetical protein